MLPVKKESFKTYYKQKTGRVIMKNILTISMLLFCCDATAATVSNSVFVGMPDYLLDTAKAWSGIFSDFGPGADIANYINSVQTSDVSQYLNAISVLGFNSTAMALYEINDHVDQAFNVINQPLVARRDSCTDNLPYCNYGRRSVVVDGKIFGSFSDYSGGNNGDFKTKNTGFSVNAKSFFSNGWLFGVEYTRSMTDTQDTKVYSDATGNSITIFSQYLADTGLFMNFGLNAGHTSWNIDKTIFNITDGGTYDTYFYAGQMNLGIRMLRGQFSMVPKIKIKYLLVTADKYIDDVVQEFGDWWYNMMETSAGIDLSFDFIGSDFVVRPTLHLGGGYDIISHGSDELHVQLIDNQFYNIPVEAPEKAHLKAGLGLNFYNEYFTAGIEYLFNMRKDYMNNIIMAKLKIAF